MPTRKRTRLGPRTIGYIYTNSGVLESTHLNLNTYEEVNDFVGKGDGYDFNTKKITVTGGICRDFATSGSVTGRRFVNLQGERMRNPLDAMYAHALFPDRPDDEILAAKLLSSTNPSRPDVDLPLAIFELKDIPGLIKRSGDDIFQRFATVNLKYQFAIKPLLKDLSTLLQFSDLVDAREKELKALAESGLRRKRTLWRGSDTLSTDTVTNSTYKHVYHCLSEGKSVSEKWGFVEWKLNEDSPLLMKGDRRALARKCVLAMGGLKDGGPVLDASNIWNAIPFSWLIDWCTNLGDLLEATRNIVGASHGPIQIMEHIKTTALHSTPNANGQVTPGTWSLETKRRRSMSYVPVYAQLPILTARQTSILGSIAITRRVPRS